MVCDKKEIVMYVELEVKNVEPMHIGNGEEEILVDEYTGKAYIPATSIAGAVKAYLKQVNSVEQVEKYWGSLNRDSRVIVYDTYIENGQTEERPGLRIDAFTGAKAGDAYFKRKYLQAGCYFNLKFEIYVDELEQEENKKLFEQMINGMNLGVLRLGAYKTAGAGMLQVEEGKIACLNLKNKETLKDYVTGNIEKYYKKMDLKKAMQHNGAICFKLQCETKTPLLIKGYNKDNPLEKAAVPMKNKQGSYIIPGTSLKGAMRGRSRKILGLLKQEKLESYLFGNEAGEKNQEHLNIGRVYFGDITIENSQLEQRSRIKIDRFRGGVMDKALLFEETIQGTMTFQMLIKKENAMSLSADEEKSIALIIFLMRDLADGSLTIGSGAGIGRGKMIGSKLIISGLEKEVILDLNNLQSSQNIDSVKEFFSKLIESGESVCSK